RRGLVPLDDEDGRYAFGPGAVEHGPGERRRGAGVDVEARLGPDARALFATGEPAQGLVAVRRGHRAAAGLEDVREDAEAHVGLLEERGQVRVADVAGALVGEVEAALALVMRRAVRREDHLFAPLAQRTRQRRQPREVVLAV